MHDRNSEVPDREQSHLSVRTNTKKGEKDKNKKKEKKTDGKTGSFAQTGGGVLSGRELGAGWKLGDEGGGDDEAPDRNREWGIQNRSSSSPSTCEKKERGEIIIPTGNIMRGKETLRTANA